MPEIERVPVEEAKQIQHIVELTIRQLQQRYPDARVLRGVHAKDHGCVNANFEVREVLPEKLRVGVFAEPGRRFRAVVRFSNADVKVGRDSAPGKDSTPPAHGSRGMAIKLLGVDGPQLEPAAGPPAQDFLMINQPVFAFANVEDYEILSRVLVDHKDDARPFFAERLAKEGETKTASQLRAEETGKIVARVRSASVSAAIPAYQQPPASPVDNDYFSASPFLFGPNHVMRFRVRPVARSSREPDVSDENYLRTALASRLRDAAAGPVVFHFEIQVRPADSIKPDTDIENASKDWPDEPAYEKVAKVTIPLQEFDTPEQRETCERLVFNPWHGLEAHRPLGGINRLRRAVYEFSARFRNLPKKPS